MTRWARSGSSQKHKKVPGDATPWIEFARERKKNVKKQKKGENGLKFDHAKKFLDGSFKNIGNELFDISEKFEHPSKEENTYSVCDSKTEIKSEANADMTAKTYTPNDSNFDDNNSNNHTENSQQIRDSRYVTKGLNSEMIWSDQANAERWKKKISKQENRNHTKNSTIMRDKKVIVPNSVNVCKKKKQTYLQRLKKKREQKGIILLPTKIESRLYRIKKKLREKGLPSEIIKGIIRRERRKEELQFRKTINPSKECYNCRQTGHVLADCPEKLGSTSQAIGICFKCGSTEHTSFKCPEKVQGYPFANCFICKEQGHISRDCPTNKRGVYPKGGRCNLCGNVNHLKKDCPSLKKKSEEEPVITLRCIEDKTSMDAENIEVEQSQKLLSLNTRKKVVTKPKIVKF